MIDPTASPRRGRFITLSARGLLAALLAVVPLEGAALAQAPSTEIEAAKKVAAETANGALAAFEAGKYEDAITGFQKAEKAFHAPKFLLYVGRSQVKLGRLLAAKDTYEGIVREKLAAYAPAEFFSAQATARKELAEITNRIPSLRVQTPGGILAVTVDGKAVSPGQAVPVDPGEHTITGTAPGRPEVRRKITVAEGEARTETLEPPPAAPATSGVAGPAADPTSAPGAAGTGAPGRGVPTVTYVAYGTGAAGLVLGAIFGGLTLVKKGEFDRSPTAEAADQGETFSHVADAGFALALVGAAVGTIVWVVSPRDSGPSPPRGSRAAPPPPGLFVAPRAAGLTIGGTF